MPNNLTIELSVRGGREARAALQEISRAVRDTASRSNEAAQHAGGGWAGLVQQFHRVREGAHIAREGFGELHKSVGELKNAMMEMTERIAPRLREALALSAAGAAYELGEQVKKAAENVHQMKNLADTVGMTTKQVQQFGFAGGLAGVAPEAANTALTRFAKNWGELSIKLKQGGTAAAEAKKQLAEIGLSGTGTAGKMWTDEGGMAQTLEQFRKFAQAISRIEDPLKRDAISVQYFGRSYAEIMPLLSNFNSLYDQSGKLLDRYHLTIGKEEEEQAHAVEQSFVKMSEIVGRERDMLGNALGVTLVPLFNELGDVVGNNTPVFLKWGEELRAAVMPVIHDLVTLLHVASGDIQDFDKIASTELHTDLVRDLYYAFKAVRDEIPRIKDALEQAGHAMLAVFHGLTVAINDVFGTNFTDEGLAAILLLGKITGFWKLLEAATLAAAAAVRTYMRLSAGAAAIAGLPAAAAVPVAAAGVAAGALTYGAAKGMQKFVDNGGDPADIMRYGGGAMGMAAGGSVTGPGGVDNVPAWLSAGEYVVKASSVSKYGRSFFDSINASHFADGGYADPTLASGYTIPASGPAGAADLSKDIDPGLSGNADLVSSILGQAHKDKAWQSHPYEAPSMGERVKAGLSALLGPGAVSALTEGILPPGISPEMIKSATTSGGFGRNSMAGGRTATLQLALPNGQSFSLNGDPNDINTIIGFTRLSRLISGGKKPSYATS